MSSATVAFLVLTAMVPSVGVAVAIAKFGVRAYLPPQRAREARDTVGAIARRLSVAYERSETLCGPASPVPSTVPTEAYMPSLAEGHDFRKGSATEGWPCIGFSTEGPIHHQYDVRIGGNYKSVARGGRDPGPNAVEVSAEGDLDGDGITSLIAEIWVLEPETHIFQKSAKLFIVDEYE